MTSKVTALTLRSQQVAAFKETRYHYNQLPARDLIQKFYLTVTFLHCSIKVLFLLFLNTTFWLGGTFLFMHLEATNEAEHKCGVKKVQRDFVDILWQESRFYDEFDWKSSARKRIMQFEDQIHEAVSAGVSSASGC